MKNFTTNLEDLRLETEEIISPGPNVHPLQIWRDAALIPDIIPGETTVSYDTITENDISYKKATVYDSVINGDIQKILDHYIKVPLYRIQGTIGCYKNNDILKDIVGPQFGKDYLYQIYINNELAPFGIGNPIFDVEMGILKFQNDDYAKALLDNIITISFYKYVGRKGMTNVESLPFSDKLIHFKNTEDPSKTASFKVYASNHQDYILPIGNQHFDKKDAKNTNVLVSQETISDVLYTYGIIDGGTW